MLELTVEAEGTGPLPALVLIARAGTTTPLDPQDGEDILSEVLEKNFERFVMNTRFEDRSIWLAPKSVPLYGPLTNRQSP